MPFIACIAGAAFALLVRTFVDHMANRDGVVEVIRWA